MKNELPIKKYKLIKNADLTEVGALKALNDGNLAIGLIDFLAIYNMKTYKVDYKIKCIGFVTYIYQLKNNYIFFCSYKYGNEMRNNLIELSNKTYIDKKEQLPKNTKYIILKENQKGILYGYCSYDFFNQKIDVLKKNNNNIYEIITCIKLNCIDFDLLKNNKIAILFKDYFSIYKMKTLKLVKTINTIEPKKTMKKVADYDYLNHSLSFYNDKFLLVGSRKNIIIYDHKNLKIVKKIDFDSYLDIIYVNNNIAFFSFNHDISDNIIDDDGNCIKINKYGTDYKYSIPSKTIQCITQVKDGRVITYAPLKIWS